MELKINCNDESIQVVYLCFLSIQCNICLLNTHCLVDMKAQWPPLLQGAHSLVRKTAMQTLIRQQDQESPGLLGEIQEGISEEVFINYDVKESRS